MSNDQKAEDGQTALESTEQVEATSSTDRREALKKLGRYALYTAPALLAMLDSNKAKAFICSIFDPCPPG
ncbi:MAG: hypothetical protein ABR878_10610 [Roseiarcus sp.]|jgi:hypothetical protein